MKTYLARIWGRTLHWLGEGLYRLGSLPDNGEHPNSQILALTSDNWLEARAVGKAIAPVAAPQNSPEAASHSVILSPLESH